MTWRLAAYVLSLILASGVCVAVAVGLWRRRHTPGGMPLFLFLLGAAVWSAAVALEALTPEVSTKIWWSTLEYLGAGTAGTLFFLFAAQYTRSDGRLGPRAMFFFAIEPALTLLIAATNSWHGWLWNSFALDRTSGDAILIYGHAPWFYVNAGYNYAFAFAGMFLLVRFVVRSPVLYRLQTTAILIGASAPAASSAIYLLGLSPLRGLDFSPFAFVLTGLAFAWSIFRYHLLDLVPVARDTLIEHMTDGVVVLDAKGRVVDINSTASSLLGIPPLLLGEHVDSLAAVIPYATAPEETETEIVWGQDPPRHLDARLVPLYDRRHTRTGCLVVLRDVTERKQMEVRLQELNVHLEHSVQARTAELRVTVDRMQNEIGERKRVEKALRQMEQDLAERVADQSRDLAALYELILYGGQSLTVEQIQDQATATIMTVMNGDAGCTHQWDASCRTLRLIVQRGLSPAMQAQIDTLPGDWLLGEKIARPVTNLATHAGVPTQVRLPAYQAYLGAPIHLMGKPIGAIGIYWKRARSFSVEDIALFGALANQIGIIVENTRLRERGEAAAVLKERQRLARDLHDSVTQSLHSLVLAADTAGNRLKQGKLDRLEASLAQLAESARQALKEMRLLLFEMRLGPQGQVDIVEALQLRLDAVERRAGIATQFAAEALDLPRTWQEELYGIAIEALNNSLKHARASAVSLRLSGGRERAELDVVDNGTGIRQPTPPGGTGLQTMAERAERIGGKLTVTCTPGTGTRVHVLVQEVP